MAEYLRILSGDHSKAGFCTMGNLPDGRPRCARQGRTGPWRCSPYRTALRIPTAARGELAIGSTRPGFTMVELLVVIGVIMVLIGLILPAIGASVESARTTADLATVRGNSMLIIQYANEHDDAYPIGGPNRCVASSHWHQPLVAEGYLSDIAAADPYSYPRWGRVTFMMSESLAADPLEFTPGFTRRCHVSPSTAIAQHLLPFPDRKGMMVKNFEREGRGMGPNGVMLDRFFCCVPPWRVPVTFCDGSGQTGTYLDFSGGQRPVTDQNGIGVPIRSAWGGYTARER